MRLVDSAALVVSATGLRLLQILPFLALGFVLEELTNRKRPIPSSARFNLTYGVLAYLVHFSLGLVWIRFVMGTVSHLPGFGVWAFAAPSTWLGVIAATAFCVVIRDGAYYGFHRLQHAWPWLWAQHELHHADESMNVTTGLRHHWLEVPFQMLVVVAPLEYLFAWPASVLIGLHLASDALGYFIHADARVHLGRLGLFLAGPMFHRLHHSSAPEHRDKNFAAICPLWDLLGGTYYAPAKDVYPATGLASGERITTLPQAFAWPFLKWFGMR
jgi:sterol desaturase/sphingolipid hydroxylase (fatty acid hydroxylase superfamily)